MTCQRSYGKSFEDLGCESKSTRCRADPGWLWHPGVLMEVKNEWNGDAWSFIKQEFVKEPRVQAQWKLDTISKGSYTFRPEAKNGGLMVSEF